MLFIAKIRHLDQIAKVLSVIVSHCDGIVKHNCEGNGLGKGCIIFIFKGFSISERNETLRDKKRYFFSRIAHYASSEIK